MFRLLRPHEITSVTELYWGELTPEQLQEVYRLAKAAFTAEDLQRYTELDEGESALEFLAELEQIQKEADERTK